jgi:branched-chain amino acid transport system permease protein
MGRAVLFNVMPAKRKKLLKLFAAAAALILINILVPRFYNFYHMVIINTSLFYFICVVGLNIMLGLGGLMSLCSITLMGVGAFVCGRLTVIYGCPTLLGVLAGALATGLLTFLLGLALLRLSGAFFMFGTMGLVFIGNTIFTNWVKMTGGPDGTAGIPPLNFFGLLKLTNYYEWFPFLCVIVVLVLFLFSRIKNSSLGRSLMAIRDSEVAALTLGINVYMTKVLAFTISGFLAGFSGALYALHNGVVSGSMFTIDVQLSFLMMVMLGGVQHAAGSLIGSLLITVLPETLRFVDKYINIFYGVMIILLMIFMPMGIIGIYDAVRKILGKSIRKIWRYYR